MECDLPLQVVVHTLHATVMAWCSSRVSTRLFISPIIVDETKVGNAWFELRHRSYLWFISMVDLLLVE